MAATYGTAVNVAVWSNQATAPNKKYTVEAFKGAVGVGGTQKVFYTRPEADNYFAHLVKVGMDSEYKGDNIYDYVIIKEQPVNAPS